MQRNKNNKFSGELANLLNSKDEIQSKLQEVMCLFAMKKHLSIFNILKTKGYEVSHLLSGLILLPFHGATNVYNMVKFNLSDGKKDAFYSTKNNEQVDWRKLLILLAQRFQHLVNSRTTMQKKGTTALIGDDSPMRKTGKKMENVSMIHDHVTNSFVLGFKILVVGFWDGGSFIPLDFSIHRERGSKLRKAKEACKSAIKVIARICDKLEKAEKSLQLKIEAIERHSLNVKIQPTNTNIKRLEGSLRSELKTRVKVEGLEKLLAEKELQQKKLKEERDRISIKHPEYGLSRKEKKNQFRKKRSVDSCGLRRLKEADQSKISMFITIIKRVVRKGFVPDYVLTDTWFFCKELLKEVNDLSSKGIKLLSMAKMGNTTYNLLSNGKAYNIHGLLKIKARETKYNRKMKAHYIKIPVLLSGIRVNLFLVKFGSNGAWRLLVTNDLSIGFTKVMEVYQLRWSIEVFFKECKQYLNLGGSCSSDFDGQIADATLSMIQHIMLTFYKRMNYQQSFGELFRDVSSEIIESSLAEKLWEIFIEVMIVVGEIINVDVMDLQIEAMRNENTLLVMKKLIFKNSCLKSVA